MPQEAKAASIIYSYAYQQITNLRFAGLPALSFQPNSSDGSSLLTFNPTPPGQLTSAFDSPESFTSSSQPSGVNLGLGNNTGFFSGTPAPSSSKGQVNADYARGDTVLSSSSSSPVPIVNVPELENLLFGAGINGAGASESYLNAPAATLFQTSPQNFFKDEGKANSEWLITSNPFTVSANTQFSLSYNWLNYLAVQIDPTTPLLANEGNLARAQVGFSVAVIAKLSGSGNLQQIFLESPGVVNKQFSLIDPGSQISPIASGSRNNRQGTLLPDINGDGIADEYTISINGFTRADTRLVEIPEPLTILGSATAFGFGVFFKQKLNRQKQKSSEEA